MGPIDESTRERRRGAAGQRALVWMHWLTVIAIVVSAILEWRRPWGLLYLWIGLHGIWRRETFLVASVQRDVHPFAFWVTVAVWLVLGVFTVLP
jgi:hypothetical protein